MLRCTAPSLLVAATAGACVALAALAQPTLATIDVYGSSTIDTATLRERFTPDLVHYVEIFNSLRTAADANAAQLETEKRAIEQKLRSAFEPDAPLAYFDISLTIDPGQPPPVNITIDVVERADADRRMPFRAAPTAELHDPGGLSALWAEYGAKVFELILSGVPLVVDESNCPVLHCVAPFDRPELMPYLERFNDGARRHEDALYELAASSNDSMERANALFLLAHTGNARRLMPALASAIYDPSSDVRNNAMRVLMSLAQRGADVEFPVRDLIAALDFPASSGRNKAGYTLAALADRAEYRDAIRAGAVPIALRMLKLEKPNNHEPAYQILTKVSGESFGARDYAAWERWAATRAR